MEVINPFEVQTEVERYNIYRPKYHHIPFNKVSKLLGYKFKNSLDVACGTGHSTMALSKISENTFGCDLSAAMLSQARKLKGIEFYKTKASSLPFADSTMDFMNISMGFHWVEQELFLKEAKRVLNQSGLLNIDSFGFSGQISSDENQQLLHKQLFDSYLPSASKRRVYPTEEQLRNSGFNIKEEITYECYLSFKMEDFVNLIKTWSNFQILTAPNQAIVSEKMYEVYQQVFDGNVLNLLFRGKSLLLS